MEEFKNGVISEEALDEIAGGLNINKEKIIDIFKKIGVKVSDAINTLGGEDWQNTYHLTNTKNKKIPYEY